MEKFRVHHFVGIISLLVGLSFLGETYQLVSRALTGAFQLMAWAPGLNGQQAWGVVFLVVGVFVLVSWHVYVRAVALIFAAGSWGVFSIGPLYEALAGPDADKTGAFAGIMALALVTACVLAVPRLYQDFQSRAAKVSA